ncbi:MAG: cell division protein FtsQ/DivIB [Acidimicrobiales bacterium]
MVDPRMRSRRIAVQRDQGRRRLKRFTLVLAGVAVVLSAYAATQTPLLDVDRLVIEGAARTDVGDVRSAARIELGDPMIGVDTGRAAARTEELPWVEHAEVVRRWPGTVEVRVTERSPAAVVEVAEGRFALVDREGRVLEVTTRPPAGLPALTGDPGAIAEGGELGADARAALDLLAAVGERLPGVVVAVSTDLDAELAGGGAVRFGSTEQLDAKVVAVSTVLGDVDMACLKLLDVRVPGSPALTRHQRCS